MHLPGGRGVEIRIARAAEFDASEHVPASHLRKMSPESRLAAAAGLMAWRDAGAPARAILPERTGTFVGSGFGSLTTTAAYLEGIAREGMAAASPLLFSESLLSAPLGHAAILLDARGPSLAFQGGDASMTVVLSEAVRAIRNGRIDRAVCATYEMMPEILVEALVRLALGAGRREPLFVGEGAAALVLEEAGTARASGARIHAEILGTGMAGDPAARPTSWSEDAEAWAAAHGRALAAAARAGPVRIGAVIVHAPPAPRAAQAESRAIDRAAPPEAGAPRRDVHAIIGHHAAAGGIAAAAAVLAARGTAGAVLLSAGSWGGATGAIVLGPPGA